MFATSTPCSAPRSTRWAQSRAAAGQGGRLPRLKTLQEFDFAQSPVSAARIADLAAGGYIARAEPVLLIGEAGTGKTHLASGLCVAACGTVPPRAPHHRHCPGQRAGRGACRQRLEPGPRKLGTHRADRHPTSSAVGAARRDRRRAAVPGDRPGPRRAGRGHRHHGNLPSPEWGSGLPQPRLQALVDRLTDRAHIIETGNSRSAPAGPSPAPAASLRAALGGALLHSPCGLRSNGPLSGRPASYRKGAVTFASARGPSSLTRARGFLRSKEGRRPGSAAGAASACARSRHC